MSFGSRDEIKEQVRQATDLVDLVSRSIRLRRQGKQYVGICPWHDDSRPSLTVTPERQSWKCWVCSIGGDVFEFVKKREGVEFPEALRILADRAGIALTAGHKRTEPGSPDDKQTLFQATAWAEEQFHRCLLNAPEAEPARAYLADRGISDDSIGRFHLGFTPNSWQWLMDRAKTTSFSPAVLEAAGLVKRSADGRRVYDLFRGRLIFSIRDTEHRPIAFGARILPTVEAASDGKSDGPKYVNSPETRLFSKKNNLYALDFVRDAMLRDPQIVVVEGYTDVIMAHQHGVNNVVAALGTALGERHVRLLQRFAEQITLVLDGDDAGQRRTNDILKLFIAAQVNLKILTLPSGLDPCDFIREQGAEAFRQRLTESVDALEHKIRTVTVGLDITKDLDQANQALEEILNTMALAPRSTGVELQSLRLREQQILVRLAQKFHVDEASLRARLHEVREKQKKTPNRNTQATSPPEDVSVLSSEEKELFQILLAHPELVDFALEEIQDEQLSSSLARSLWQLYQQAQQQQVGFNFEQIMIVAEDSAIKYTLVKLVDEAHEKAEVALEDAESRLHGLVRDFRYQRERTAQNQSLAALPQGDHDKEEIEILQRMFQNERGRQGL